MLHPKFISFLPKPIACRAFGPLLAKYVEEESTLTDIERGAVNEHLANCTVCQEEVATMASLGALLRQRGPAAMPAVQPGADLWSRIEARMDAEEATAPVTPVREPAVVPINASRRRGAMLVFAPAFAAVVVGVVMIPRLMPITHQAPKETLGVSAPAIAERDKVGLTDSSQVAHETEFMPSTATHGIAPPGAAAPPTAHLVGRVAIGSTFRPRVATAGSINASVEEANKTLASSAEAKRQAQQARDENYSRPLAFTDGINRTPAKVEARRDPFVAKAKTENMVGYFHYNATGDDLNELLASDASKPVNTFALDNVGETSSLGATLTDISKSNPVLAREQSKTRTLPLSTMNAHIRDTDNHVRDDESIVVVDADAGSGVSANVPASVFAASASKKARMVANNSAVRSSPAEVLNRQRQRRGLFGGYGIATSAAILPAGDSGVGTIPNVSSPW